MTYLKPGMRVLDIGGGPGRYTVFLAQQRCHVSLADLSPELLEIAKNRIQKLGLESQVENVSVANAIDLSQYESSSFDAVLSAGPFYHLVDHETRLAAAKELKRVLKSGGLIFVAFMPWLSGVAGLLSRAASNPAQVEKLRNVGDEIGSIAT